MLPFSTSAVGDPGAANLPLPTVLMAVNVAAASVMFTLVWVMAARRALRLSWLSLLVINPAAGALIARRGWLREPA